MFVLFLGFEITFLLADEKVKEKIVPWRFDLLDLLLILVT